MGVWAVFLPLGAFLVAGLLGKKIGDKGAQFVTCAGVIVAALMSIKLFFDVALGAHPSVQILAPWMAIGDFAVNWSLRLDTLSVVMMCVINIVSACVHVYSVGYMSHDESKGRFMAYLSLFTFAMLMLVTSDNLLQLFFGWEGVGVASYLLIGFWNHKESANAAAQKAFVVNRVGDFGLALGMFAIFAVFGSIDFQAIFDQVPEKANLMFSAFGMNISAMTVIGLLLFMGAVGKSAQLGLHTWLPDAMEGPTPVSALIHAATMVTAGVFLVARMSPLFEAAPDARMVVTIVGAATAFVAATIGLTQFDIKRVIAYSTMSQLGYMFFALGVSAYGAAMFHLVTHAFFKALLFLGAGSVIHAVEGEQDMRKMGGLWRKIPFTYVLMWVGSIALAGLPPLAGYYSKDMILESAWAAHTGAGNFAFIMGILAAFMTACYSWRLLIMTFHGKFRGDYHVLEHAHESPAIMLGPLVVLAVGAVFAGAQLHGYFVGEGHETFWGAALKYLPEEGEIPAWVKTLPLVSGISGIALAYILYLRCPTWPEKIKATFAPIHALLFNKWFFDELYACVFVKNAFRLGRTLWGVDRSVVDRFGPDGSASMSGKLAQILSRFQSGFVYQYAFVMIISVIGLVSWFVFKKSQGL